MNERLRYAITLTVRSPFMFRGLEGSAFGIDTPHLRDELGRPIIPADQIRGVLRAALAELADANAGITGQEILKIFGDSSDDQIGEAGRSNDPRRGAIIFSDLTALDPLPASQETTRIGINDDTGAVATGMLQVIELVAPFGAAVCFSGEIVLYGPADKGKRFAKLFGQALALVSSIGAFKSAGFGEVVQERSAIALSGSKPLTLPATTTKPEAEFRRLRMTFDRPVLVDGDKIADNAVLGASIIPGAVIKGALAQRLALAGLEPTTGAMGGALSKLSISHAFPESDKPGQPYLLPLPASLVAVKEGKEVHFGDALKVGDGDGAMIADRPAAFATDWKDPWFGAAAARLGRPKGEEPPGLARTHTAIDPQTGTAADKKLFTTIARSVLKPAPKPAPKADGVRRGWLVDIDLGGTGKGEERALAEKMIAALLADGLDGVGKTAAHADFEPLADPPVPVPRPVWQTDDQFAVMLTTPALMLDLKSLVDAKGEWVMGPWEAYAAYWRQVSPDFELVNFFAEQAYSGGHLARRRRLYGPKAYFPFMLTRPGAIFLIKTTDTAKLTEICRYGLPLPKLDGATPDWSNCPYVRENGYGRVVVEHLSTPALFDLTSAVTHV